MSEGPVRIGSFRVYQVAIFVIVFIWALMGFEVAQVKLVPLYEQPLTWITWSLFVLVSIVPTVGAVAWRMKTQVVYIDPVWNLREREITLAEYEEMMKEYRREYRDFLSEIDYELIALAGIIALTAVTIPFLLMRTTFLLIASTPVVFGFLVLLFGLVCASFVFKIMSNEATQHFPTVAANSLRPLIDLMHRSPGLSWIGVRVVLGEASGFYSIRNVSPVARIEGIESVAMIKGETDDAGNVSKLFATMALDGPDSPRVIDYSDSEVSAKHLAELILKMLQIYIKEKGEEELLDEVVEEVTAFLSRFQNTEIHQSS